MNKFLLIDYELNVIYTNTLTEAHKARISGITADLIILDVTNPNNPQELDPFSLKFFPVMSEETWLEFQSEIEEECDYGIGSP